MAVERNWEADWYHEEDKPDILALNQAEYGDATVSQEAYFDWLCFHNPAGTPVIPVAREKGTGKVIAFCLLVPLRVSCAGEERRAIVGTNLLVAPAFRRQGIHNTLRIAGLELCRQQAFDFFYVFPNARSLAGLAQWDFDVVCQIPLLIRPLDIAVLTNRHIRNPLLRWSINLGWALGAGTFCRIPNSSLDGTGMDISEDSELDESYDHFWERIKAKYKLVLIRDRTYLQWRFLDNPSRHYQVLSARQGTDILGYAVLRQADIRGDAAGLIADLLVLPGKQGEQAGLRLLSQALEHFKQAGLSLSGGLALPHTQEYAFLRKAGHLRTPQRFAPQMFHLVVKDLSGAIPRNLLVQPEGWYITIADHDAV